MQVQQERRKFRVALISSMSNSMSTFLSGQELEAEGNICLKDIANQDQQDSIVFNGRLGLLIQLF